MSCDGRNRTARARLAQLAVASAALAAPDPGRSETCLRCGADLRVCLNCAHYNPRVAQQCRDRRAEPVLEKHAGNFCEYFEFASRV